MSCATIGCGWRSMTPVRSPRLSAERTTWRRPAAAGWNCWTRWPVGGGPWEARRGGWSGSSWTSTLTEAGRITHPALDLTAELPGLVSEPLLPAFLLSRKATDKGAVRCCTAPHRWPARGCVLGVGGWRCSEADPAGRLDVARTTWFVVASTLEEVVADGVPLVGDQREVVLVGRRPGLPSRPTGPGPPRPRSAAQCCADSLLAGPRLISHLGRRAPGLREPHLRLGGFDFRSSQVLLDVDVEAPFQRVDLVVQASEAMSAA
jgi:hypothetical protein